MRIYHARCVQDDVVFDFAAGGPWFHREAAEFNDGQRKEIEAIIKDYLLANPEILQEMGQLQEQKQNGGRSAKKGRSGCKCRADIPRRDGSVVGNPKGKVTMVEFFDYNCGWCKRGFPEACP